jgi:hypothetical protein
MFSFTKSTVAIGLLAVTLAPLPALAHDRDDDNYSNVRVIRYDPNSHGDIYEDSNDGKYHANGRFGGGHHHKKKKRKHRGRFGGGDYEYHNNGRFGGSDHGSYNNGRFGGNQPQSQPQTNNGRFGGGGNGGNQSQQNCTTSRFGTVCR